MRDVVELSPLTASQLMRFLGCQQSITLDLQVRLGEIPKPSGHNPEAEILRKLGDEHESAYLKKLKADGKWVETVSERNRIAAAAVTRELLFKGPDVIFQGVLMGGDWGGVADFLERVPGPSLLGDFHYEVADTKLKRTATPKHVLQLMVYSDILAEIQGVMPKHGYVELGKGKRQPIKLNEFAAYSRHIRRRLEDFIKSPWPTRAQPCPDCNICHWSASCEDAWLEEDSLFNVAGISRSQVAKLENAGIRTMAELANVDHRISGIIDATRIKISTQARLQHDRKDGEPTYILREPEDGKGFALLPKPEVGDVYYDIEGDPHYPDGLEYLHGVWFDGGFKPFWAHDHAAEKDSLQELLDFFEERIRTYPDARIYHYAPYEITALKRLTAKYGIGEVLLDRWLRQQRFVDLYSVVRGGLLCSEKNYSIKSLEVFYGFKRDGDVKTAGGSVVAYEEWRETRDQKVLDDIEYYNKLDCVSTEELRNWLLTLRPEGIPWMKRASEPNEKAVQTEARQSEQAEKLRSLASRVQHLPDGPDLCFNLGLYHRREEKPTWWAVIAAAGKEEDELLEDFECLAGLKAQGPVFATEMGVSRRYTFPDQDTKIRAGKEVTIPGDSFPPPSLTVEEMDLKRRTVVLTTGESTANLLADSLRLHPPKPVPARPIPEAIEAALEELGEGPKADVANDLLSRSPPRLKGHAGGRILPAGSDLVQGTISAVLRMDGTVLPVQGPPGTGKTYVTARAILAILAENPETRIGVSGPTHEAIKNLLLGCSEAMETAGPTSQSLIAHMGANKKKGLYADEDTRVVRTGGSDDKPGRDPKVRIVGGTAWFFASRKREKAFDWVFIDEAGQVGLANALAITRATRNLVLVGDPQQLPQVVQGSHPGAASLSCLQWMIGEDAIIPDDRGIFLSVSRRMHPDVCRFISERVYDGRLQSFEDTVNQRITGTPLPEFGAHWRPVKHLGCAQSSQEEADAIVEGAKSLLTGTWTDKTGASRAMTQADLIVVAPYNAQVNAIRDALKEAGLEEIPVGTVDSFQGQEAPACLVSMTASSVDESPRGMDFLLSLNRINVSISRAKALALVFGSPRLLEARCETIQQMRLANTLCALEQFNTLRSPSLPWSRTRILGTPAEPIHVAGVNEASADLTAAG